MIVSVSGSTYREALDPQATAVPEGWPAPTSKRAGKGRRYTYELSRAQALQMLDRLHVIASGCSSAEFGPGIYAIRKDVARLSELLGEAPVG